MIRKNEGIVVGFDFGTTNSLISLIQAGQAIPCVGDDGQPIPSVICYEGGDKIIGRQAKERLSQAGLGIYRKLVKTSPGQPPCFGKDGRIGIRRVISPAGTERAERLFELRDAPLRLQALVRAGGHERT